MNNWVCNVCGYISNEKEKPNTCPVCKANNKFIKNNKKTKIDVSNKYANNMKYNFKEIEYEITSAAYFQSELKKIVEKSCPINNRYISEEYFENDTTVWKFDPCKVKNVRFEIDKKNKHDPNAIKIIAGSGMLNMTTIGYIPQDENIRFKELLDKKKIYNINLIIYGGEKKIITKKGTINDKINFKVILKILIKK